MINAIIMVQNMKSKQSQGMRVTAKSLVKFGVSKVEGLRNGPVGTHPWIRT